MGDDPSIGEYERLLFSMKTTARKELVLLHPDRYVVPGSTREWLKVCSCRTRTFKSAKVTSQNRPWVHQHIHVELPVCIERGRRSLNVLTCVDRDWYFLFPKSPLYRKGPTQ